MLTEKLVQYHALPGHSQGCLSTEEVRFYYLVYSPYWDKPRLPYFIGGTREPHLYWIIPGLYCVNTLDNTLISHVVPTGTSPVKRINKMDWVWPTNF